MLLQMTEFNSFSLCVCVCIYIYIIIHSYIIIFAYYIIIHTHIFLISLSTNGHLACFHILTVINNASVNIGVHVAFRFSVFVFSGYVPRSRIAG